MYKEIAKFSTWVYTIAGNLAKTELRRRKRHRIFSVSNFVNEERDFDIPDRDHSLSGKSIAICRRRSFKKRLKNFPLSSKK